MMQSVIGLLVLPYLGTIALFWLALRFAACHDCERGDKTGGNCQRGSKAHRERHPMQTPQKSVATASSANCGVCS